MKKILFALKNMNVGGVEKSLLSLLSTIDRSEYDVDLLLLEEWGDFLSDVPEWVNIIISEDYNNIKEEVNLPPLLVVKNAIKKKKIIRALSLFTGYVLTKLTNDYSYYYKQVFSKVKKINTHYDIAVSYTSIIEYLTWYVLACVNADEYIGWIHFDISKLKFNHRFMEKSHKKMKRIYVVSEEAKAAFVHEFPKLEEKCELKYNVINKNEVLKLADDDSDDIRQDGMVTIVTVGRLTREKGQDIIPEVAEKLKADGVRFRWYLIGTGELSSYIMERCKELKLEDEVKLLGMKKNPYVYMKQADIYVQTSVHEGYCITLAEAKVFGMPIVSTEFSGAHEQLDEREDCMIVDRNVDSLISAIKDIITKIQMEQNKYGIDKD